MTRVLVTIVLISALTVACSFMIQILGAHIFTDKINLIITHIRLWSGTITCIGLSIIMLLNHPFK